MHILPGFILLQTIDQDDVPELAELFGGAGIPLTLFREEGQLYASVPAASEAAARKLLEAHCTASSESRKEESVKNFRKEHLLPAPGFMSEAEKLRNRSRSAFLFIGAGAVLLLQFFFFLLVHRARLWPQLVFSLLFLIFGLHTLRKNREQREALDREARFSRKVLSWFFRSYTAEGLDKIVLSCRPGASGSALDELRRCQIRDYLSREFDWEQPEEPDRLTEQIFAAFYGR